MHIRQAAAVYYKHTIKKFWRVEVSVYLCVSLTSALMCAQIQPNLESPRFSGMNYWLYPRKLIAFCFGLCDRKKKKVVSRSLTGSW